MTHAKYDGFTREQLIARLHKLDMQADNFARSKKNAAIKAFNGSGDVDWSKCYRRKIALKFCYDGWDYNGLAIQGEPTALPTVEAVLQDALYKKRLIDPDAGAAGCEWARCGRTDKGVSAAGQVVSLYIRSNLRDGDGIVPPSNATTSAVASVSQSSALAPTLDGPTHDLGDLAFVDESASEDDSVDPPVINSLGRKEFPYVSMLNRVLPPSIRILAWAPVSPTFSARFSCRYRHYKYFFSPHGLDLSQMREAASLLLGEHDFRNFCKLDAAKQISNFRRRIDRAEISPVDAGELWVFDLIGSAFLWHQVRHIMAVLFMVASGAEPVSLVRALLNVDGSDPDPSIPKLDRKPEYEMADGLPLVLWDCSYDAAEVPWVADAAEDAEGEDDVGEDSPGRLLEQMTSIHVRALIQTTMHGHFLEAAKKYRAPFVKNPLAVETLLGGGRKRYTTRYVPVLQRNRQEHVEILNEKWRQGKGTRRANRAETAAPADDADE
ncbi:tRNA pseudouridine synthase [Exidia glandulosa HHB12029]|uniref:tRNA pseudouridine synthase n=1 Tax=Exidia glandulosa HHB12029 TaxID=1314781 RepID=A0A165ELA5_EXIGL|nr:tRNA pseudouridine synthase [Exidia glandulosa HHB12029]